MGRLHEVLRYDSKETIHFTHSTKNRNSLPSDKIITIVIDHQNTIWVGIDKGLAYFNNKLQQFEPVTYSYKNGDSASIIIISRKLKFTVSLAAHNNNFNSLHSALTFGLSPFLLTINSSLTICNSLIL